MRNNAAGEAGKHNRIKTMKPKRILRHKRSNSTEKPQRPTLIQEMLQSKRIIDEEQDEGDY